MLSAFRLRRKDDEALGIFFGCCRVGDPLALLRVQAFPRRFRPGVERPLHHSARVPSPVRCQTAKGMPFSLEGPLTKTEQ